MKHGRYEKTINAKILQEQLRHVYWIGGGSGSGKSTIARRIADQYGLRLYATDEVMADHTKRVSLDGCPFLSKFIAMGMDERWVDRSPKVMFETFHWYHGEGFDPIVEDLLRLPKERGIVVEGLRLLPFLVKPLLSSYSQAVWLLPTPKFRQIVFKNRDSSNSAWGFLEKTSDPEKAMQNLLERDRMFTERLYEETKNLGLPAIQVDITMTENDLTNRVTEAFGL
jgi:hypothetical protein